MSMAIQPGWLCLWDLVRVNNFTGSVEKIGLRSTRIRTDQKTFVTVPNKQMVDSILDNLSLRTQRRGDIRLELALQTSPQKLQMLIDEINRIVGRPEIEDANVFVSDITSTAIIISSDYYTAPITIREFNAIKQEIHMGILSFMDENEISISGTFPEHRKI